MVLTLDTLNFVCASGGVILLVLSIALIADLTFFDRRYFSDFVRRHGLALAAFLTIVGSLLTLIYSEVFGLVPCGWCWVQRVFLYPQAFIMATALVIKDKTVALYGIVLSVPGLLVAVYQHYLQMGGSDLIGCPTAGGDCAKRIVFEFGFMTFPLMSAALFLFLLVLYTYIRKVQK